MPRNPVRHSNPLNQELDEGDLPYFQEIAELAKLPGTWEKMHNYWRFRCDDGPVFNWWPSTGSVNFQGPREKTQAFKLKFLLAVCDQANNAEEFLEGRSSRQPRRIPVWADEVEN